MATNIDIYADLEGYKHPSIITGQDFHPDLLVIEKDCREINVVELTVGFETNLENNTTNKANLYKSIFFQR